MKDYQKNKNEVVKEFTKLLTKARRLIEKVSKGNNIELAKNGVTFRMIDPFDDDGFMYDVERVEDGVIYLDNGSEVMLMDVTNLTDLVGLLETIDE